MWKEQNHAPKKHRNFGDEWGRLSITLKNAKPFSFCLSMDGHVLKYDGSQILYSSLGRGNVRRPAVQILRAPTIPLKKIAETFQVLCKRIDPEVRDFVLEKIKENTTTGTKNEGKKAIT
jgi:hypothetical protein